MAAKSASSSRAVILGLLLSAAAAAWLFSKLSFAELAAGLRAADARWLVASLGLFFAMFGVRAYRWAVLLGGTPFSTTWHANAIGYFFNATLPLRAGEVARAYVIAKKTGMPIARALSAVLVERLLDLASVVLLFFWFARRIPMRPAFTSAATVGAIAFAVCVLVAAVFVHRADAAARRLRPLLERRLGVKRADAALSKLVQVKDALKAVGSPRRMAESIALTVLVWALTIALAEVCLHAFMPDIADVSKAGLVVVMANLGGALPSAPGGLGIVQSFATSALVVPFGAPEGGALAFVLAWSLGQTLVLVAHGIVSIGRLGLSFNEIRQRSAALGSTDVTG